MTDQTITVKDPLLRPLTIKKTVFRNRVISTSHACGLQKDGFPQDAYQAYHEEKARGGLALSMFGGSSNVDLDSPNVFSQLNVGTDEIIPHFQRFSDRMHGQGAALMCQITHLGRRAEPYSQDWLPAIAPSPVREALHRAIPREMDEDDIARVVAAFAAAAKRCEEGGLDGIETLAGGHVIGQFMSPKTNLRTDRFGGTLANRMRFALMVHEAIRRVVSDDFLVGMRFVVDEGPDGTLPPEECLEAAQMLCEVGAVDFFNAIYGSMDTARALSEENMPGMGIGSAPWVDAVGRFKEAIGVPVFHAAKLSDLATARYAIESGKVDMAGLTRPQIADPHMVRKLMEGKEDRIRPCVGAGHCQSQFRPKCLHNAATGRETLFPAEIEAVAPADRRKAVVVGAGPAGLEAARVLALRGHEVQIFDAAARPGGQLLMAAQDWRRDLISIVDWRLAELQHLGIEVLCNRLMDEADITALQPDLVILATGGLPQLEFGEGADLAVSTWDLLSRQVTLKGDILVWDGTGRHSAQMAAIMAHDSGANITFATMDKELSQEQVYPETTRWRKEFAKRGLRPEIDSRLVSAIRSDNRIRATLLNELTREEREVIVDHLVVEMGTLPMDDLFEDLRPNSGNNGKTDIHALVDRKPQPKQGAGMELHRIGDAQASRNVHAAIYDAFRLCRLS